MFRAVSKSFTFVESSSGFAQSLFKEWQCVDKKKHMDHWSNNNDKEEQK